MFVPGRFLLVAAVLASASAQAVQLGDPDSLLSIEVHGFASQGLIYTTHQNNYLATHSNRSSFEFSEIGLNFTKQLLENLRFGFQLFSRDLGPIGNYAIKADWYYVDYHFADWLGARAGRIKLPFGLYNDTSDIDSARVPVLLPTSVYQPVERDALLALTGFELYGRADLGKGGALDYRGYVGTIFLDATGPSSPSPNRLVDYNVPYVAGARLLWETPIEGLTVGMTFQSVRLNATFEVIANPAVRFRVDLPINIVMGSLEYVRGDLLLAIEYSRWFATTYFDPALIPPFSNVNERGYVMLSYRVKPWFTPGIYYSLYYPNTAVRKTRADEQHDIAATLRFDINQYFLIKAEGHFFMGTANLNPALNDNRPLTALAPFWGAFFLKATAHF